jgi:hypothetical protein
MTSDQDRARKWYRNPTLLVPVVGTLLAALISGGIAIYVGTKPTPPPTTVPPPAVTSSPTITVGGPVVNVGTLPRPTNRAALMTYEILTPASDGTEAIRQPGDSFFFLSAATINVTMSEVDLSDKVAAVYLLSTDYKYGYMPRLDVTVANQQTQFHIDIPLRTLPSGIQVSALNPGQYIIYFQGLQSHEVATREFQIMGLSAPLTPVPN